MKIKKLDKPVRKPILIEVDIKLLDLLKSYCLKNNLNRREFLEGCITQVCKKVKSNAT